MVGAWGGSEVLGFFVSGFLLPFF